MGYMDLKSSQGVDRTHLEKIVLARKVGRFLTDCHADDERLVVEQVALKLAQDLNMEVRRTLAFELRMAQCLSRDLADRIARDVEEVSSSFLANADVFADEDLALLARSLKESARIAIARRSHVPDVVSLAIAEAGTERSVTFLVRNPGADLSLAVEKVLDRFGTRSVIMDSLGKRGDLPLTVIYRLIDRVSSACRVALVHDYGLNDAVAAELEERTKAHSLLHWVKGASYAALNSYIRHMEQHGALTDRFLADITARGGIRLLEKAVVYKSGIDITAVQAVLRSDCLARKQKLLKKCGYREDEAVRLLRAYGSGLPLASPGREGSA